jgi:hypothetical protein
MRTQHQFLQENIGTSHDENYAFWLVTLLSWLLTTLIIALGLLDPLLVYVLSKKKQQKDQDVEGQSKAEDEEETRLNTEAKLKVDAEEKARLDFIATYRCPPLVQFFKM